MRRSSAILLFLMAGLPRLGLSQQRGAPLVAMTAGVGNAFGGFGLRAEFFVADGRLGLLAGGGILPGNYYLRSPFAGAASVRYYFGRQQHRLFVDASWSPLDAYDILVPGVPTVVKFGPGVSLGYTFQSKSGLTLTLGAGVGRTSFETVPIVQLGFGWTWRRSFTRRGLTSA